MTGRRRAAAGGGARHSEAATAGRNQGDIRQVFIMQHMGDVAAKGRRC